MLGPSSSGLAADRVRRGSQPPGRRGRSVSFGAPGYAGHPVGELATVPSWNAVRTCRPLPGLLIRLTGLADPQHHGARAARTEAGPRGARHRGPLPAMCGALDRALNPADSATSASFCQRLVRARLRRRPGDPSLVAGPSGSRVRPCTGPRRRALDHERDLLLRCRRADRHGAPRSGAEEPTARRPPRRLRPCTAPANSAPSSSTPATRVPHRDAHRLHRSEPGRHLPFAAQRAEEHLRRNARWSRTARGGS
ncbi:hypothetical protein SVIOM342S_03997 [Streptomyces violaceorubidus]